MRTFLKLAVAVGLAIVFIPKPQPRKRTLTLQDRRRAAQARCTGTLFYDSSLDMFFDMHGKVGTAIKV